MDITPLVPEGLRVIRKYGDGSFTVNDERFERPILLFAHVVHPLNGQNVQALLEEVHAAHGPALSQHSEILLVGCGRNIDHPSPEIVRNLRGHKLALDFMDTGSACRTYNILLTEGRQVAAVLVPV